LIQLGHRRIGLIAAEVNKSSERRLNGYKQALLDHQIAIDNRLIAYGNYSVESGYQAMRDILPYRPEAVFSTNDAMALGCLRALREAKIRIPDDMSLMGLTICPMPCKPSQPLTTVQQPIQQSGSEAVELLLRYSPRMGQTPVHHSP